MAGVHTLMYVGEDGLPDPGHRKIARYAQWGGVGVWALGAITGDKSLSRNGAIAATIGFVADLVLKSKQS